MCENAHRPDPSGNSRFRWCAFRFRVFSLIRLLTSWVLKSTAALLLARLSGYYAYWSFFQLSIISKWWSGLIGRLLDAEKFEVFFVLGSVRALWSSRNHGFEIPRKMHVNPVSDFPEKSFESGPRVSSDPSSKWILRWQKMPIKSREFLGNRSVIVMDMAMRIDSIWIWSADF